MNKYFQGISRIEYRPDAGPEDTMVFRHYNASETVQGRTMEDWFKFSVCYFNSFRYLGGDDYYGDRTRWYPWEEHMGGKGGQHMGVGVGVGVGVVGSAHLGMGQHIGRSSSGMGYDNTRNLENYKRRMVAAFEFFHKLGVKYYSASDRDFAPEGESFDETNRYLDEMVTMAYDFQMQTGVRPLYFSADLFSHPRYMNGAAANPDAHVFAYACAQVKRALDIAKRLDAQNFVFFHPRDGYQSLLQRQMFRDMSHMAQLYRMAVQYRDKIGFRGQFLIQPKPQDPRRHQYESDSMATMHLLRHFGLERHFKLYIKPAFSRMMGRPYEHDVYMAAAYNMLGMVDASDSWPEVQGTSDICARNIRDATYVMKCVMEQSGLQTGGFNLGGRMRREAVEPRDLFHGHILAMDTFAHALRNAGRLINDGCFSRSLQLRYQSYKTGFGERLEKGAMTFEECEDYVRKSGEPQPQSNKWEHFENMLNYYIYPAMHMQTRRASLVYH